jgi:hypothetical protein
MEYENITEAFEALELKQQLEVLSLLTKIAYKGAGGKKKGTKRSASEGTLKWNKLVSEIHEELKETNPTASRSQAMAKAAERLDEMDPAGAAKRAADRQKRAVKKAEKDAKEGKTSKASSKVSSVFSSDSEESEEEKPAPKKETKTKAKTKATPVSKPEPEPDAADWEPEEAQEAQEPEEPEYKAIRIKGKAFVYTDNGNCYEGVENNGNYVPGDYVGHYQKINGKPTIDSYASEIM